MVWLDSLSGGRASLTMPRAILRVATEKAGAGMCRHGCFGQDAFTGMEFPTAPWPKKPAVYRQRAFSLLVIRLGFEPKTHSLEGCCSIQLSYRTILKFRHEGCPFAKNRTANIGIFYLMAMFQSESFTNFICRTLKSLRPAASVKCIFVYFNIRKYHFDRRVAPL